MEISYKQKLNMRKFWIYTTTLGRAIKMEQHGKGMMSILHKNLGV